MKRSTFVASGASGFAWGGSRLCTTAATPARTARESDQAYNLTTTTGILYGSLRAPANVTHPAVVLIVAGSGPTDRDGNGLGLRTDAYRLLADALETRGIATLRYDKRGIGASAAAVRSEDDLRFATYVDDAVAWIAKLRLDKRFQRVGLAGHSEGSLIGMLTAQRTHLDGFASLCGAAFPAADELRRQLAPKLAVTPELAKANERILSSLVAGQTVADVPQELLSLYRPSVQPYLISWLRIDPRVEIAKVTAASVVIGGTADLQIPASDAQALSMAQSAAKLLIVDGMSHVLKDAAGMTPQEQAATVYVDPRLPVMTQVPSAIAFLVST
jgi:pimeloyl-ACP methyl ester carboxylesterase